MAGLYLHIPFCRRKCPYCDFFSLEDHRDELAFYPDLLLRHLELARERGWWEGPFDTVFFGGGTPSLLPATAVGRLLDAAARLFGLTPGAEVSLEANPGTVGADSLAGYRAAGVNRLSLGVQSLDPAQLRGLGRIHTPEEAKQAVHLARRAGFANVGLDLMFALPGQSEADLAKELEEVLTLGPEHLSCYGLTVEEQTPFFHLHRQGGLQLPDEETFAALFFALHDRLAAAGFEHYEISNYARPGFSCRHNLGYWRRRPCLGIGAGAHSFLERGWGERWAVPPDLPGYAEALACGRNPAQRLEVFDRAGALAETLYLGLRTAAGVDETSLQRRFGRGLVESFPEAARRLRPRLARTGGGWRLDPQGWVIYDHLIQEFF